MGRPKKMVTDVIEQPIEKTTSEASIEAGKQMDKLYEQLEKLMAKNKIKKTALAQATDMSYQGFLNSLKSQNIKLEHWYLIGDLIGKPFVARFESAKKASNIHFDIEDPTGEMSEYATSVSGAAIQNELEMKDNMIKNSEEKIALLEKQVSILEDRLRDKNMIIDMLQNK